jgi:predicted ATPase
MRIRHIDIVNFRGIDELPLDFTDPEGKALDLVVFYGQNGCGKTSVLEACIIGLSNGKFKQDQFERATNTKIGTETFSITPTIETRSGETKLNTVTNKPDNRTTGNVDNIEYFTSWRYPEKKGPLPVTVGKKGKRPYATESNRLWLFKQFMVNSMAKVLFDKQPDLSIFESPWSGVLEKIQKTWKLFYPERESRFVVKTAGNNLEDGFDLYLDDPFRAPEPIPIEDLSSGEIEVMNFIGTFIRRPLDDGILFIDEPELHLHPKWHRTILHAIRTMIPPDQQIICATHSWDIVESVYSYQRFRLGEL